MNESISVFVLGIPRARPRARSGARIIGGKARSYTYHPKKIRMGKNGKPTPDSLAWVRANEWYEAVKRAVKHQIPAEPWDGPFEICITAYLPRPKSLMKKNSPQGRIYHTSKPDFDNIEKSITDALVSAGVMKDDSQICVARCRKFYHATGEPIGAQIYLYRLTTSPADNARIR